MPDKSVREMTQLERKHHSLSARVFRATLTGAVLLGFVALLVGLGLYTYALINQYTSDAFDTSRIAGMVLQKISAADKLCEQVTSIYNSMSEEERQSLDKDAYRERFAQVKESAEYKMVISVLDNFCSSSDLNDIYLAMYMRDPARLVYIADPETKLDFVCEPGDWEAVDEREAETFLTLNWDRHGRLRDISSTDRYGWMCTAGVPMRNADKEIVGYVLADITLTEVEQGMKAFVLQYLIAMFVVVNLVGYAMSRRMHKTLVAPINSIAEAAKSYAQDKRAGLPVADHFSMLNIRTGDEIENLGLIMADMEQDLALFEEDLTRITAEKERISTELALANRIQLAMLPHIFPPFPDRREFDIYASMDPAKEVGGDFYDFFLIDKDHLCLVMADVSGKGIPAALFMMASKIILKSCAMLGKCPSEILTKTNEAICSSNPEEMFVTVWLGILEISTGKLIASNAGHEYPILKKPDGSFEVYKDEHGFVLGAMDGIRFRDYELQLEPGTKLFVYTDGLPEATSMEGHMFGLELTLAALNRDVDAEPEQLLTNVSFAVECFVRDAEQFDDLTMLCLDYRGPDGKP